MLGEPSLSRITSIPPRATLIGTASTASIGGVSAAADSGVWTDHCIPLTARVRNLRTGWFGADSGRSPGHRRAAGVDPSRTFAGISDASPHSTESGLRGCTRNPIR
jgi:hypothetical protein